MFVISNHCYVLKLLNEVEVFSFACIVSTYAVLLSVIFLLDALDGVLANLI